MPSEASPETSGKGLLTKESIQRTIKSKWFLPALAIGGVIVVLLVLSRRRGAGATAEATDYPGTSGSGDGSAPSTFDPSQFSSQIADLFGEFQSGIDKQIQQQNAAIEQGITSQSEYLKSSVSGIESQLQDAVSSLQSSSGNVGYYDPFAGSGYGYDPYASYGVTGYGEDFATQPFAESSSIEYTPTPIVDNYSEPSTSLTMESRTATGKAIEKSTAVEKSPVITKTGQTGQLDTSGLVQGQSGGKSFAQADVKSPSTPIMSQVATKTGQTGIQISSGIARGQTGGKTFAGVPTSQGKVMTVAKPQALPARSPTPTPVKQAPKPQSLPAKTGKKK